MHITQVHVALATAFSENGELDAAATAALAVELEAQGAAGFLIGGTTGEGSSLSSQEIGRLVETVRAAVPNGTRLIAGVIRPDDHASMTAVHEIAQYAPDAILVPPTGCGLEASTSTFYKRVHDWAGGVPIFGYHWPARYPPGLGDVSWLDLPVSGVKDSSGDLEELERQPQDVLRKTWVGSAALTARAGALGCAGVILAVGNTSTPDAVRAISGDEGAVRMLVAADAAIKSNFPASLKQQLASSRSFPQGTRM